MIRRTLQTIPKQFEESVLDERESSRDLTIENSSILQYWPVSDRSNPEAFSSSKIRFFKRFGYIQWLEFEILQSFTQVRHACFTSTLPICPPMRAQVQTTSVIKKILLRDSPGHLVAMHQVHGIHLHFVENGHHAEVPCDAIATNEPNTVLVVQHADCQPCLFFDPIKGVIAAVHSGWRGSVQNIYQNTLTALNRRYGCNPEDVIACIGPSLGPCHAQFIHHAQELPESFSAYKTGDCLFDFWAIAKDQLLACGLQREHIEKARLCTYCQHDDFSSYRRDKTLMRNVSCIALKNELEG
jgi:polyphenol oxidase